MANWASPRERFVEVPGVVEIRWVSDDPDYYVRPHDLFDQQATNEGLPDWYGKKDKATTEQAYFTCNVCECDLKSVVTLRAHCKGTQHIRKALQKKKEYRDSQKILKKEHASAKEEDTEDDCNTLFECLEQTSEPAVGLENITEYKSSNSSTPYYHCNLEGCYNEQGDCHKMNRHIMVFRHKQSWLHAKLGVAPQHSSEINQKIAEYTKDYKRDYRLIKIVEDDDLWRKCKKSQIRAPRVESVKEEQDRKLDVDREEERRSRGTEERDYRERERRSRERDERVRSSRERDDRSSWERTSRGREENRYCDMEERRDRSSRAGEEQRSWKRGENYQNGDSKRKRSRSREGSSRPSYRSRSRERNNQNWNDREVKVNRETVGPERTRDDDRGESRYSQGRDRREEGDRNRMSVDRTQSTRQEEQFRISKRERDDREGESRNSSSRQESRNSNSRQESRNSSSRQESRNSSSRQETTSQSNLQINPQPSLLDYKEKSQEDEIQLLHRKVADCVKKRLNTYWAHIETTEPKNRKINSADEYTKLAKFFSHKMRSQIKETYEQYERTLEGITLTADNREQIKIEIDMYFDSKPVITLQGYR